jgi:hypothetical protein
MRSPSVLLAAALSALLLLSTAGTSEAAKRRRHRKHQTTPIAAPAPTPEATPATEGLPEAEPAATPPRAVQVKEDDRPSSSAATSGSNTLAGSAATAAASTPPPALADGAAPPARQKVEAEAEAAPTAPAAPAPPPLATAPVPVKGKWSPLLYGIVELDMVHDSTQSFQEFPGNGAIARTETFAGSHGRTMFGARHSRLGLKLAAPEYEGIKASGIVEMDFLGNQPANPPGISEAAFFSNPAFRIRHFALKVETAYVDLLLGQYWQLFGWQSYFHPNSVEIPGLPGQAFSRTPQARVSRIFKSEAVNVEAALAAARPPQRDAETPDGQAGLRLLVNGRKALHTVGAVLTSTDAMGIGVSGVVRRFVLPELTAAPVATRSTLGWGVSVDALVPIISAGMPGSPDEHANALTLTGSFVTGSGIADLYTGLTGGIAAPVYPAPAMGAAVVAPIDAGLVAYDAAGVLHSINWLSYMAGLQYYLPPSGKVWIALNYSHMSSGNIAQLAAPAAVFTKTDWIEGNLFWEATPAVRFGAAYAYYKQTRGDGESPKNQRIQLSSWFIF